LLEVIKGEINEEWQIQTQENRKRGGTQMTNVRLDNSEGMGGRAGPKTTKSIRTQERYGKLWSNVSGEISE